MNAVVSHNFFDLDEFELLHIDGGWSLKTTLNVVGVVLCVGAAAVAVAALPAVGIIAATTAATTGFKVGVGAAAAVGTILTSF